MGRERKRDRDREGERKEMEVEEYIATVMMEHLQKKRSWKRQGERERECKKERMGVKKVYSNSITTKDRKMKWKGREREREWKRECEREKERRNGNRRVYSNSGNLRQAVKEVSVVSGEMDYAC